MKLVEYLAVALIMLPTYCVADHAFLDASSSEWSDYEIDKLFDSRLSDKIVVSYAAYSRGDVENEDLSQYWNRVFHSVGNLDELNEIIVTMKKIDDANICVPLDNINLTKVSSLKEICKREK